MEEQIALERIEEEAETKDSLQTPDLECSMLLHGSSEEQGRVRSEKLFSGRGGRWLLLLGKESRRLEIDLSGKADRDGENAQLVPQPGQGIATDTSLQ